MPAFSPRIRGHIDEALTFLKWVLYACNIGLIVGAVAVAFHYGIDWAAQFRAHQPWVILFLPLGGVVIVLLYRWSGMERDRGTNLVLTAVREAEPIRLRTAPLIFLSTILTHLVGGSAGREGAALQLGGSIGAWVGRKIHLDEMYYAAIVPCVVSSLVSVQLARFFGLHIGTGYLIGNVAVLGPWSMAQVCVMGVLCALLSILFCKVMHAAPKLYAKYFPNPLVRAAVGGALVLLLTLLVGEQTYNGAGDAVIRRMLAGETISEAFLLKLVFTALTLGAGFRGGEIVPVLFTGAAFGTVVGPLLGLSQSFGGALGMTAVFCGATNCPITSILLAYELFTSRGLPLYALCCAISYMLSGYYGLYSEQKIIYSKFKATWVDRKAE